MHHFSQQLQKNRQSIINSSNKQYTKNTHDYLEATLKTALESTNYRFKYYWTIHLFLDGCMLLFIPTYLLNFVMGKDLNCFNFSCFSIFICNLNRWQYISIYLSLFTYTHTYTHTSKYLWQKSVQNLCKLNIQITLLSRKELIKSTYVSHQNISLNL